MYVAACTAPLEQARRSAALFFRVRPLEPERALAALDHAVNGVDRLLAGDFTGRVPAHAVGNHPQAEFVVTQVRVLVHRAPTPDVGPPVGAHDVRRSHDWHSSSAYQCFTPAEA